MAKQKNAGHIVRNEDYHSGPTAAKTFHDAMRKLVTVPKKDVPRKTSK